MSDNQLIINRNINIDIEFIHILINFRMNVIKLVVHFRLSVEKLYLA